MKAIFPYVVICCMGCVALVLFLMCHQSGNDDFETSGGNRAVSVEIARNPGRTMPIKEAKAVGTSHSSVRSRTGTAIPDNTCRKLAAMPPNGTSARELSQMASEKNQVMDELLNQDKIDMAALARSIWPDEDEDSRRSKISKISRGDLPLDDDVVSQLYQLLRASHD